MSKIENGTLLGVPPIEIEVCRANDPFNEVVSALVTPIRIVGNEVQNAVSCKHLSEGVNDGPAGRCLYTARRVGSPLNQKEEDLKHVPSEKWPECLYLRSLLPSDE